MRTKLSKQSKAIALSKLRVGNKKYPNYKIAKKLKVSKSTLALWLDDEILNEKNSRGKK